MKKRTLMVTTLIICLIILLGSSLIIYINQVNVEAIIEDDIENISKLSSSIIYAEIDSSLTKPIFVGQTMANDFFLKNWLLTEQVTGEDSEQTQLIQQYLAEYQKKYDYETVFLVSAQSNIYYCVEGINKVVDPSDAHDIWYYNFIRSQEPYQLDVDMDEVNGNQLTVFVNCRVEDADGRLLGVVGVGLKMSHLQALLERYEKEYDLKACLINKDGVVQVDSDPKKIETTNFFDDSIHMEFQKAVIDNKNAMEIHWYPQKSVGNCLITQYIPNLDWYIIIEKTTYQIKQMLTAQFHQDLVFIGVIILLVLFTCSFIINKYNRLLIRTATTDDVTNLPNAKMFHEMYARNTKRAACSQGTFFMFDIDGFKRINDQYGHLFGNTVLYQTSALAQNAVGNKGIVARWGGDEFVGVIYDSAEKADIILQEFMKKIASNGDGELAHITISIGVTRITAGDKLDTFIKEADFAMYRAKASGKNQIVMFEKNKI